MLFNCWYDNYFRDNNNFFGNSIIEGKDKVVTFLCVPTDDNQKIELSDINVGEYACTNYGENSFWIYLEKS